MALSTQTIMRWWIASITTKHPTWYQHPDSHVWMPSLKNGINPQNRCTQPFYFHSQKQVIKGRSNPHLCTYSVTTMDCWAKTTPWGSYTDLEKCGNLPRVVPNVGSLIILRPWKVFEWVKNAHSTTYFHIQIPLTQFWLKNQVNELEYEITQLRLSVPDSCSWVNTGALPFPPTVSTVPSYRSPVPVLCV